MKPVRFLTVVGARPQFIKAAAVSRAARAIDGLHEVMVHTGQHFDAVMSDIFFEELGIPEPAHRLHVSGGGHGEMTGRMLVALEPVVVAEKPDLVLIYGDTNSTLAGALVAAKLNIPIAHVEAGLRSFNRRMPEEVNRVLADHLASLRLCPTTLAVQNLAAEGIRNGVHHVGDVMYDATLFAVQMARSRATIAADLSLQPKAYSVATIHRAENTDDAERLRKIVDFLRDCAGERPIILPLHPRTKQAAERFGIALTGLKVIPPIGYLDMAQLLEGAANVYTDSGGLQKEAYFHRVPCVTLREETEWEETISNGWNRLWTVSEYQPRRDIPDYGAGHAAESIVTLLEKWR
jgi:UDP-GlcNAc3NAcA epimerase